MGGKIIAAGLSLFLGLSSLYAQEPHGQSRIEPSYIQVDFNNDEFYKQMKELNKKEIVELYIQDTDRFYQKYRNYNSGANVNASLDSKVFEALGDVFLCHNFLDLEEKSYISESKGLKELIYFFPREMVNENHCRTIVLYSRILEKISKNEPPQEMLKSIYTDLKYFKRLNSKLLPEDILVNYALSKAKLDSFQLSLIYYDLAQVLGADFSPVRVRDKFFIQYEENKFFNPFDGVTYSKAEIIKNNLNIVDGIKNGVNLQRLTQEQLFAIEFARFGWSNVKSMERERLLLEDFNRNLIEVPHLLKKDPKGIQECLRVFTQNISDLSKGAEHCFTSALLLDDSTIETYLFRGQFYHQKGINFWDPDKTEILSVDFAKWNMKLIDNSIDDFQKIIGLDPGDWRA